MIFNTAHPSMGMNDDVPFYAEEAMLRLAKAVIGTRPFFWPMHEQPVLRRMGLFDGVSCPVAGRLARRGFYVPSGMSLTDEQCAIVANTLHIQIYLQPA